MHDNILIRVTDRKSDSLVEEKRRVPLKNLDEVPANFFLADCKKPASLRSTFYSGFAGIPPLKETEKEQINQSNSLNVIIIGLDSLSRVAFERFLPRTLKYLKEELHATIFDRYSILGDGTPPGIRNIFG